MSEELKPCPFCGNPAEWRTSEVGFDKPARRYIGCTNCACYILDRSGVDMLEEWNRRQEAKPLTVEQIRKVAGEMFTAYRPDWCSARLFEIGPVLDIVAKAIHAAMPPGQSARIAELEAHLAACTEYLEDLKNHIANAGWTRHQQAEAEDIEQLLAKHMALLKS